MLRPLDQLDVAQVQRARQVEAAASASGQGARDRGGRWRLAVLAVMAFSLFAIRLLRRAVERERN